MLGLYEAANLRVHGEDILDEALTFTTTHLTYMVEHLEYPLADLVAHALKRPLRKSLVRLEARWYIPIYKDEPSHDTTLLKLAKLDFNLVQSLHKEELRYLSRFCFKSLAKLKYILAFSFYLELIVLMNFRWWKELDLARKLPFVRDRLVEGYFWILGAYFEPQYVRGRRILTKVISMLSILDDIYDAYGTIEELELLTEAIERFDACI